MDIKTDNVYMAFYLIEILFEAGLINQPTYISTRKRLNLHILQNN